MVTEHRAERSTPIVVDASAVLAWLVEDAAVAVLERLFASNSSDGPAWFIAPAHLPVEVANALAVGERRGRWSREQVGEIVELFIRCGIVVEPSIDGPDLARVLDVARAESLTSYDAAYLELAARTSGRLLSFDRALNAAATRRGVELAS
jgi:predicted nucleic acid-binding protein